MKNLIHFIFVALLLGACSTQTAFRKPVPMHDEAKTEMAKDSTEYELLILDIGFESWFATRNHISTAHSNTYYKNWNQLYVSEWNQLYLQGNPCFENYIEYDPFEDYGLEINYKLYNYFQFVEEKTGITLVRR